MKLINLSILVLVAQSLFAAPTGRYKVVVDKLNQMQVAHSAISQVFSIGKNAQGEDILAIRVSTNPTQMDTSKIGHIVVSTHHGNELAAPEFTLAFIDDLLARFQSDELYRGKLADTEWTIIPVLNISGYNNANRNENGMDPNRDYPGPCISATGGRVGSIKTLMQFLGTRTFSGSLTVHGYAAALTYPWGVSVHNTHSSDHNLFEKITRKAAEQNGYQYGTSTDVVYPCDGAYEDYVYWKYGMWSMLLELRDGSANDISRTVKAMAVYFDQLDSTPSTQHALNSQCSKEERHRPDLRFE